MNVNASHQELIERIRVEEQRKGITTDKTELNNRYHEVERVHRHCRHSDSRC